MFKMKLMFFLMLLFCCSCRDRKDSFYSKSCGYDCKKIPLIKPIFIGATNGVDGIWYLTNENNDGIPVSSVNVLDSVIISYYYDKYIVVPENRDTTWYIHIPSHTLLYEFSSEDKFYEQVKMLTDKQIEFIEVPSLYNILVENGYLEWFPEEFKNNK